MVRVGDRRHLPEAVKEVIVTMSYRMTSRNIATSTFRSSKYLSQWRYRRGFVRKKVSSTSFHFMFYNGHLMCILGICTSHRMKWSTPGQLSDSNRWKLRTISQSNLCLWMNLVPIELRQNGHMHGPRWAGASLLGAANKQTVEQERELSWSIVLNLAGRRSMFALTLPHSNHAAAPQWWQFWCNKRLARVEC